MPSPLPAKAADIRVESTWLVWVSRADRSGMVREGSVIPAVYKLRLQRDYPEVDYSTGRARPSRSTRETSSCWESVSFGSAQCTVRPSTVIA
ncbi:hypothetical protein GCM10020229_52580 [Kitasatospora albolonga]